MPRYRPETAELKAKRLTKLYTENNFNQVEVAKKERVTKQAINQRLQKAPVKKTLLETLEHIGLTTEEDAKDLRRLRKAQRPIACDVFIRDKNGKLVVTKNENDWIDVDDNPSQLKALEMTLKLKGNLSDKPIIDNSTHLTNTVFVLPDENGRKNYQSIAETRRSNFLKVK